MRYIKVFAPGTVANLGCGFDVMGLTLDGVGDLLEVGIEEGAGGLVIRNRSGKELPAKNEDNVITPAVMALLGAYEKPVRVEVTILEKIAPGSGIGSSAASSRLRTVTTWCPSSCVVASTVRGRRCGRQPMRWTSERRAISNVCCGSAAVSRMPCVMNWRDSAATMP